MKKNVNVAESISVECNGMVFKPVMNRMIIKELHDKKKYFPTKNEDGVLRPKGVSFNEAHNDYEEACSIIYLAKVLAIGPLVENVEPGDEIMYDVRASLPLPVKFDGDFDDVPRIATIDEGNIRCVIKKIK